MGLIVVSFAVVAYALVSRRLGGTPITGPMIFMVLGVLLGPAVTGLIEGASDEAAIDILLEVALALILFTDALGISAGDWRRKGRLPARLLVVGMPLTIVIGALIAAAMFPAIDAWEAALIGICLAPTDAALGLAVITDRRVPDVIRQSLNIESGLNDGLALPFFVIALSAAVEVEGGASPGVVEVMLRSLVYAAVVGAVVGWAGAKALSAARSRGWVGREWTQIATLALILLAFGLADVAEGSGFIAAWVAGVAFGRTRRDHIAHAPLLAEDLGSLLATLSFLGFGALLLGPLLERISWEAVVYAVLSLTLTRMVPVALAMLGRGFRRPTVLFVGWFGPRGLASIVFALFVLEEMLPGGQTVVDTVFVTVAISVLVHGATAVWGAARYGRWFASSSGTGAAPAEAEDVGTPVVLRRLSVPGEAAPSSDP